MIEQLKELLQMQEELDEKILNGKDYPVEQMKIALFVELGELMNELPTKFKHWKKSAKDNRENALVEYVDALHFQLSLFNYHKLTVSKFLHDYDSLPYGRSEDINDCLLSCIKYCDNCMGLLALFNLGYILEFSWEEIYNTYKSKNKINHERQNNNY